MSGWTQLGHRLAGSGDGDLFATGCTVDDIAPVVA